MTRRSKPTKDYGFNQIGNLIAGRGERPFAPTEEWRSYLILIEKTRYVGNSVSLELRGKRHGGFNRLQSLTGFNLLELDCE